MATSRQGMADALAAGKFTELKQRLLFVLGALLVFRIGSFITVPGIDPATLAQMFEQQQGTILAMFNMFSGGALSRLSVFALGIMPYISASIIMQLLTKVHPKLEQLNKEEKITFIFSTHDQRVVNKARRVITIEDGKIISDIKKE